MRPGHLALRCVLGSAWTFLLLLPAADGANWPRFRGPNGTGIAADKDIPVQWTDKEFLWKTPLPGSGNGSPIVWGDKLFLQAADTTSRMLLCLDVKDGKILWNRSVPGGTFAKINARNSLASSTPATDGERVYCYFWDGTTVALAAYDFQGNPLWQYNLGEFVSQHGAAASPMVVGDRVIVNNDQDGKAELVALEAKTGKPAWRASRQAFRACYSVPFLLERDGKAELIAASTAGLTSYDPLTGTEHWKWVWNWSGQKMALRTVGSPVTSHGLIFVPSGDGSGARRLTAVDIVTKKEVWDKDQKQGTPYVPCLLTHGDHLYWANDRGIAYCLEARTGKEVWNQRLTTAGISASPVLIDGKIYAVSEDGTVSVFAAAPTFQLLAKNSVPESVIASPAVADNRLFIRGKTTLYCIGKK